MKEMSDLISRKSIEEVIQRLCDLCGEYERNNGVMCGACNLDYFIRVLDDIPSAEPEERTAKVENKWHWSCDPYDESTSPTEAGYYRIIDEDGTEMTDYFFGEPRMTRIGIGYWATCEKTILAWSRLEVTDGMA